MTNGAVEGFIHTEQLACGAALNHWPPESYIPAINSYLKRIDCT
jgi:hypothetical protein